MEVSYIVNLAHDCSYPKAYFRIQNNESTSNEPIEIQSSFVTQLTMPSRALNEIQVPVNISDIKIKIPLRNTATSKFGLKTDNMPSEDTDKENS